MITKTDLLNEVRFILEDIEQLFKNVKDDIATDFELIRLWGALSRYDTTEPQIKTYQSMLLGLVAQITEKQLDDFLRTFDEQRWLNTFERAKSEECSVNLLTSLIWYLDTYNSALLLKQAHTAYRKQRIQNQNNIDLKEDDFESWLLDMVESKKRCERLALSNVHLFKRVFSAIIALSGFTTTIDKYNPGIFILIGSKLYPHMVDELDKEIKEDIIISVVKE